MEEACGTESAKVSHVIAVFVLAHPREYTSLVSSETSKRHLASFLEPPAYYWMITSLRLGMEALTIV